MTTATDVPTAVTTQVYRVYIRASRERVWQAITDPEWTVRFGYGGRAEFDPDLRPGATYRGMLTDAMKERGSQEGHPTKENRCTIGRAHGRRSSECRRSGARSTGGGCRPRRRSCLGPL